MGSSLQPSAETAAAEDPSHENNRECGQVLEGGIGSFDEHDRLLVSREAGIAPA